VHLVIVAVGHRMPDWVEQGFADYTKRMPSEMRIELREIKPEPRATGRLPETLMQAEAARIRAAIPKRSVVIALDEAGLDLTTVELAHRLERWRSEAPALTWLIGGPDGLDASLKAQATLCVRLSSLTLPHAMVRVLLAEQLYRAWSVNANHPYHRV
jgi:23S rRNA (pseudouridine1915-N3)-methyltransferase